MNRKETRQATRNQAESQRERFHGSHQRGRHLDVATVNRLVEQKHAFDQTAYAASLGYEGTRAVIVMDGKVVSHGWKDWFDFCDDCRTLARRRLH